MAEPEADDSCWGPCSRGCQRLLARLRGRPSYPKTLYLIRHGESAYNAHYQVANTDPMDLWDAPLTAKGEGQARSVQERFPVACVDLVLSSPLTRALQTALLAMPLEQHRKETRYEVSPLVTEHAEASCDFGRSPAELAADFPGFSFAGLDDVWWYVPEEHRDGITMQSSRELFREAGRREPEGEFQARVDAAAAMLARRPERTIAIFGHADFFHEFLLRKFAKRDPRFEDAWMRNCEVISVSVDCADELLAVPPARPIVESPTAVRTEEAADGPDKPVRKVSSSGFARLRREIATASPHLGGGEVARQAAQAWKALSPAQRAKYMDVEH